MLWLVWRYGFTGVSSTNSTMMKHILNCEEVKSTLEATNFIIHKYLSLIDAVLSLPGRTWEVEQQRQINAIDTVTKYYGMEEGFWFFHQHNTQNPTTEACI